MHTATDGFGDHQVGCGGNGDRIVRHNDVVFSASPLAPRNILGSQSRPADVFSPTWLPAASQSSPLQQITVQEATTTALSVGENRKLMLLPAVLPVVSFIPIVFEARSSVLVGVQSFIVTNCLGLITL